MLKYEQAGIMIRFGKSPIIARNADVSDGAKDATGYNGRLIDRQTVVTKKCILYSSISTYQSQSSPQIPVQTYFNTGNTIFDEYSLL